MEQYECYFDASYRLGLSRCAFYIQSDGLIKYESSIEIRVRRSDLAEARALSFLLNYIKQKITPGSKISVYGDAQGLIESINRNKNYGYIKLKKSFQQLKLDYDVTLSYIPRAQNDYADKLSKGKLSKEDLVESKSILLSDIIIPRYIMQTNPNEDKYRYRLEHFKNNGCLYRNIEIDETGTLVDGYISYLILKENGVNRYDVDVVEIA